MAISVDWPTKVITVPKADTTLVDIGPPEIRSLDLDQFRKDLNALQAGEEGMPEETTHVHTAPVSIGGVNLARLVEIVNSYTVTFESGAYAVNLVGANSNVGDVLNLTSTSIRSANSAGLITTNIGSGMSGAQDTKLDELHRLQGLKAGEPMTVTKTSRTSGDISQTISGDGVNTSTVNRS